MSCVTRWGGGGGEGAVLSVTHGSTCPIIEPITFETINHIRANTSILSITRLRKVWGYEGL